MQYRWPLFVYPTRSCNYRCSYCFTESSPTRPVESFVITNWERLVDQAASAGVPEVRLSGGEPLVIPDIEQMCRTIVRHGMQYTITTNGSLLKRHLAWLLKNPPETLWLSFHREYGSVETFINIVRSALLELPRIGLNIFASDWDPVFASVGVHRIKLLSQSRIGRAENHATGEPMIPGVGTGTELRFESTTRHRGISTCVLRSRPLLSIDHDGAAYACCVTVGHASARVGHLTDEPFRVIAERTARSFGELPCGALLPGVLSGEEGCPVRLYSEV